MAQPSNTFDSYDAKGIREDLENVIYDISPEETPFYTACKKLKATTTLHEWQTDGLRSSAANAHIEGDDTAANATSPTVRMGNYTQIFKNAVVIADTDEGLDKAGRATEMAYQTLKIAKEQKLDIEKSLLNNLARNAGSGSAARISGGVMAYLETNIVNKVTGGKDPQDVTGYDVPGSKPRTDGTTPIAFTQTMFDTCMQDIWTEGGRPDSVYLSATAMNVALGFQGNNNQRSTVQAGDAKVVKSLDIYVTPWGTVEFVPSRENRGRDVLIMQDDMWGVAMLRPTKNTALAKTGDSTKRQVLTELTLVSKNEKASGAIVDIIG
jgi:hypothetical protein